MWGGGITASLHRRSPHLVRHPLLVGIVVVRLRAVGSPNVVVLVIHVVVRPAVRGLRVDVVVLTGTRRRQSLLRGRLPSHGSHVRASIGAASALGLPMVGRRRWLEDRRRVAVPSGVRSDGGTTIVDGRLI